MNKRNEIILQYHEYDSIDDLTITEKELIQFALVQIQKAYAPYSEFKVGAAILLADGGFIGGSNQENAAYPSGLCAERVAAFSASAIHPGKGFDMIAIAVQRTKEKASGPICPCGSCRQVLIEYELRAGKPIRILCAGADGKILVFESVADLLPFAFGPKELNG